MAKEFKLKYGCNPNQAQARIYVNEGELPVEILSGNPGYINFLDAMNGWQLVTELKEAFGIPAATSFKHVSPAGAAIGLPLNESQTKMYHTEGMELSPLACAYARARGTDRMSSFGDWVSLSEKCDVSTARLIENEVSDGVIAPDYEPEALEILKNKRKGKYNIIKMDPNYRAPKKEIKMCNGVCFEQDHNTVKIDNSMVENIVTQNKKLPDEAKRDLIISLITLKYTQSNSICFTFDGQTIGVGAGQQSRIHCTRIAGDKAEIWFMRQHPKTLALKFKEGLRKPEMDNAIDRFISLDGADVVLDDGKWENYFTEKPVAITLQEREEYLTGLKGVSMGSDAFIPFDDNIDRAFQSGVSYIVEPGGSIRDNTVIDACNKYGMVMSFNGLRLFHH